MSKRETVKASEAGAVLAGPGMSEAFATERFRRWQSQGIIPPVGRAGERRDGRDAFLFDQAAPAVAAVLFWAHDFAGLTDRDTLASFWRYLAQPHDPAGVPPIDHVLAEVADGRAPVLVLTRWGNPQTGEIQTTAALRFDDEYERPIEGPSPDFDPIADIVLELAPLLERFIGGNVVPFVTPDVVN